MLAKSLTLILASLTISAVAILIAQQQQPSEIQSLPVYQLP